ncbi:MAG: apolipoprotein N-acyltransferase [Actinobacteria bacterium]|nr:apolipoprotein N-acyltransferase [Actinomycetota bacterium]
MKYLLALIFAALAAFAFEPYGIWLFAVIGMAGWFTLLTQNGLKNRIYISYIFGACLLLMNQHWTGIYVGNLPWLILSLSQALMFIVPAFFVRKGAKYNQYVFALSYVLTELLLRTVPFTGFGWTRLSFTQVDSPLAGIYPIGGVALVALVLALVSSARKLRSLVVAALIPAACWLIPANVQTEEPISIALVQGGVVNLGLDFNSKPQEVFKRHLDQSISSIKPNEVDLIIWPENAVDVDVNTNPQVNDSIKNLSTLLNTPILIGAVTKSIDGPKNQSILYNSDKGQIYTKRYLTPFGEYLPLRSVAEKVSKYSSQITDFKAGEQNTVFDVGGNRFNTLICYELINDIFVPEVKNDFLVIQTNNATFGDTNQLDQQLNIARVRALESARDIAYVSTTGTTSFISSQGKILSSLDKFKPATLKSEISATQGLTYRQFFGHLVEPLAMIVLLVLCLIRVGRRSWSQY